MKALSYVDEFAKILGQALTTLELVLSGAGGL
jgi:hypothetical protein